MLNKIILNYFILTRYLPGNVSNDVDTLSKMLSMEIPKATLVFLDIVEDSLYFDLITVFSSFPNAAVFLYIVMVWYA